MSICLYVECLSMLPARPSRCAQQERRRGARDDVQSSGRPRPPSRSELHRGSTGRGSVRLSRDGTRGTLTADGQSPSQASSRCGAPRARETRRVGLLPRGARASRSGARGAYDARASGEGRETCMSDEFRAPSLVRRAVAEGVGTALLLATVVGSGIMGERLAGGNVAVALLANTLATGAVLVALILTFAPLSGAQLNPAVTLAFAWERRLPWRDVPAYLGAQVLGAFLGVAIGTPDVRPSGLLALPAGPTRPVASAQRVRRDLRTAFCDLGVLPTSLDRGAVRGRGIHHRGLLVHGIDVVRQPGRDACPSCE